MRATQRWAVMALAALLAAFALSACGSSSSDSSSSSSASEASGPSGGDINKGVKGGKLTLLAESDVDQFDPGLTYEQFSFSIFLAADRQLYQYGPPNYDKIEPDIADGMPKISKDEKTVTIKIKKGIKFSPPVNRAVTSKDVAYAMQRTFTKNVPNGYTSAYWPIAGIKDFQDGKAKSISGLQTPDDSTLVVKLDKPQAGPFTQSLVLPATSPVPADYAAKYDKNNPSTYGNYQVTTGPYMFKNDSSGKVTGHDPGKSISMVRNPNWDPKTDFRKGYVDSIFVDETASDPNSASRKILSGSNLATGNTVPDASIMKRVVTGKLGSKDQLAFSPGGGGRYVALNTALPPFNDINVRKAVIAGSDRDQLRLSRGGPLLGDVATHVLSPGLPGFEESGGVKGFPEFDWLKSETGNAKLSAAYFKKAGFKNGKYSGPPILMVGENEGVPRKTAEVMQSQLQKMGFKINLKLVPHDVMYQKFCNVPKEKVNVCPNVGFFKDFNDPQTLLDLTFNGEQIVPVNNSNWSQLNDPKINQAIDKLRTIVDEKQRAKAAAAIDKMVTAQAPNIPWIWDKNPLLRSNNVVSIPNNFSSSWDLAFTYIKK